MPEAQTRFEWVALGTSLLGDARECLAAALLVEVDDRRQETLPWTDLLIAIRWLVPIASATARRLASPMPCWAKCCKALDNRASRPVAPNGSSPLSSHGRQLLTPSRST